ncbi:rubrerythrin family protein [Subtercola boreus]|uniref:Rubrerythrin family protein n=1 Tax=Subtercola boreus TaxID=120213 RepID=A0A3E0VD54_9MICO|nr:VIT1/CCC1 family protein [Subtercola boreus]RFA07408.1 rubrerythrin family protein [Subtercola boreus]
MSHDLAPAAPKPRGSDIRRWRQYLADERAEAAVYRDLAERRTGEERAILLALAEAEARHESHWRALLGDNIGNTHRGDIRTRILGFLARRFGSVFVLALAQRAETRSPYANDSDATPAMAADEQVHAEVVRGLAARGRNRLSGTFRAAVFGANDGLVSNLALVIGISASGVPNAVVLVTGLAGLLAGALSMGAGEYVSVRSQRELLEASTPNPEATRAVPHLDVDANELALVYRARGMSAEDAEAHATEVLRGHAVMTGAIDLTAVAKAAPDVATDRSASAAAGPAEPGDTTGPGAPAGTADAAAHEEVDEHEAVGTGLSAAVSSFCFFASGAIIPVLPYLFGLQGLPALIVAAVLVGIALLGTGAVVGILSGGPPLRRALRQLAIGYGAAGVTYLLGLLFGTAGL